MSMLYLLANFTLAFSMQPHMQIVTTVQILNPETFFGFNAKERCDQARELRVKKISKQRFGKQEIVGMCMSL